MSSPHDFPEAFIERITTLLGAGEAALLTEALALPAPTSLRLNPLKAVRRGEGWLPVDWCDGGFILPARPSFTADPLLHAGGYYVQEAASMFIAQAYASIAQKPRRVLDLCAAPGGKSTLWRALLPDEALLVANEIMPQRAQILAENLAKWGHAGTVVCSDRPGRFARLSGFFDVLAVDAPCSGEGMFRKDPDARKEWSEAGVAMCAERQRAIVHDAWPALREGGWLVYSTCTFAREENEDNVRYFCETLGAESVPVCLKPEWGVTETDGGYRFYPHRTKGEGFFIALLRKTARQASGRIKTRNLKEKGKPQWLNAPDDFALLQTTNGTLTARPRNLLTEMQAVETAVHTLSAGITIGEVKGRKIVPAAPLALAADLCKEAFPTVSLSLAEALSYLRREALTLPSNTPQGYCLVTFKGLALGFMNNLGTRANNMYPAQWRIRNQNLPTSEENINKTL